MMVAAVGIGVLEIVVVDKLVGNRPCQEDENADYVAGDGGIAQDGGDAHMGPKEAVLVTEVREEPVVVLIVEVVVLIVIGIECGRGCG